MSSSERVALVAKGMTFLSEPAERPYGIEATLRDDSGTMMSLVQPLAFEAARHRRDGSARSAPLRYAGCPGSSGGALR